MDIVLTTVVKEIKDCMKWEKQNVVIKCIIDQLSPTIHRMNIKNYECQSKKKDDTVVVIKDILIGRDYWNVVELHKEQCIQLPLANICMTADPQCDGNNKMIMIANKICDGQTGKDLLLLSKDDMIENDPATKKKDDLISHFMDQYINKEYIWFISDHRKQNYEVLKKLKTKKEENQTCDDNNNIYEKILNNNNNDNNAYKQMENLQSLQQQPASKKKKITYGIF